MEAAEKANFDGVRTQLLFAIEELDLARLLPLSDIPGQGQLSPPWSPNSTSSRDHEPKPEESKCAHCGKVFKTIKAKYGHMRIHGDRSGLNLTGTLESTAENTPEAVAAAFILMEMSSSKLNGCYMESSIALDLDEKKHIPSHQALVEHRSSHKKNGEVQKISPKRKRGRRRKVKSESRSHVCEVCNKSYPTGHQLGGHKRAHPRKDPTPADQ